MKFLVVLAVLVALCAGSAVPAFSGDNSHYVEGESRYLGMPDGDNIPQLVELKEPVDEALQNGPIGRRSLTVTGNNRRVNIVRHIYL